MTMEIKTKEIKQSSIEKAFSTYHFICADLNEGLNYGVSTEVYEETMAAFGTTVDKETCGQINSRKFCDDVYVAYTKYKHAKRKQVKVTFEAGGEN